MDKATRRQFLQQAAIVTAVAGSCSLTRDAWSQQVTAPSDRLAVGVIGTGGMGNHHLSWLLEQPDLLVRAISDVDQGHLDATKAMIESRNGSQGCHACRDFRDLLARDDIDAVWVVTPDHWHALVSIAAAAAGKDIYCEKPLANSIGEGRAICNAVERHGRILQCGSHERSNPNVRFACELVRNGFLGKIHTVRIYLPCDEPHHQEARQRSGPLEQKSPPAELDYDTWLGHTPWIPYAENRCHFWWRFRTQFGGGELTDRGAHVIDIAQLALGKDDTGPVEIRAQGTPLPGELYDACLGFEFENSYADGVRMIGQSSGVRGLKIEGQEGSIFVHIHGGKLEAEPASLLDAKLQPHDIQLGRTPDHRRNFLDAVRSRDASQLFATAEIGHRTATICHLNQIAIRLNRKLQWDPQSELFVDDDEANQWLLPKFREPWQLPKG